MYYCILPFTLDGSVGRARGERITQTSKVWKPTINNHRPQPLRIYTFPPTGGRSCSTMEIRLPRTLRSRTTGSYPRASTDANAVSEDADFGLLLSDRRFFTLGDSCGYSSHSPLRQRRDAATLRTRLGKTTMPNSRKNNCGSMRKALAVFASCVSLKSLTMTPISSTAPSS